MLLDPKHLCRAIAIQLGWDSHGDYYEFLRGNLARLAISSDENNTGLVDKLAKFMGWNYDYEEKFKTKSIFVMSNIDKVLSHYEELAKFTKDREIKLIEMQTEIDNLRSTIADLNSEIALQNSRENLPA